MKAMQLTVSNKKEASLKGKPKQFVLAALLFVLQSTMAFGQGDLGRIGGTLADSTLFSRCHRQSGSRRYGPSADRWVLEDEARSSHGVGGRRRPHYVN